MVWVLWENPFYYVYFSHLFFFVCEHNLLIINMSHTSDCQLGKCCLTLYLLHIHTRRIHGSAHTLSYIFHATVFSLVPMCANSSWDALSPFYLLLYASYTLHNAHTILVTKATFNLISHTRHVRWHGIILDAGIWACTNGNRFSLACICEKFYQLFRESSHFQQINNFYQSYESPFFVNCTSRQKIL